MMGSLNSNGVYGDVGMIHCDTVFYYEGWCLL